MGVYMKINLWKSMLAGDNNAFIAIYETHYQSLFAYGFSISTDRDLTKDCIQELFLEIWNTRSKVNKDVIDIRSYLFTWLRRKIGKELNITSSHQQKDFFATEETGFSECSYEELLVAFQQSEENKEKVRKALKHLTKKQMEIIRLRFFENLSYSEIALQTSLSPRTVYNFVYEALKNMKEYMRLFLFYIQL